MNAQTQQTQNYDDFLAGNDIPEQVLERIGFRRIQHFNESHYHRGTAIERGGYGIRDEDETAPDIGPRQTIKHLGGRSSVMRVATEIEIVLIGLSSRYFVAEYDDPADEAKRVALIVSHYVPPEELPGKNARCRSAISLFVVPKADPGRQLYELAFRGFNVEDAILCVNRIRRIAGDAAEYIKGRTGKQVTPHPFLVWAKLGVGESRLVGKKEQSPVTPPKLAMPEQLDVASLLVSGEDFRRFVELRRELDGYLATGRYAGVQPALLTNGTSAPALTSGR